MASERVCAVVVTYNRKNLLRECLLALLGQSRPLDCILIVENVSTDGTLDLLASEFPADRFPTVQVFPLAKNVGGAGGFHAGMKRAASLGYDWIWLMDDDTIAEPGSLAELFAARDRADPAHLPAILASKVVWTDGSIHPMNVPRIKRRDLEGLCQAALAGTVSLRSSSFVSMLLRRDLVERYGLPNAEYFIWNDDVEYSARVLRHEFGVLVPKSVVHHKTTLKQAEPGPRFYYGLRNHLWMVRLSPAWSREESVLLWGEALRDVIRYVCIRPAWSKFGVVARALKDGLLTTPAGLRQSS